MIKTKQKILLLILVLFLCKLSFGQSKYFGATISNNVTGLPVLSYPSLFYSQFHPGVEATYGKQLNQSEKNKIYLNTSLSFYYHQFVQSLVKVYPTISYERQITDQFSLGVGLGAGYGISFEGKNAFKLLDDGTYDNKAFLGARSQYLIALEFGAAYQLFNDQESSPQLLLQFKSFMQGTYVKSYVPLLPLNALNIGVRFPL